MIRFGVLVLLLLLPPSRALAQITVSLPVRSGAPGTLLTVPVAVTDLTGKTVNGYQFTINFDPGVIDVTGALWAGTLSNNMIVFSNSPAAGEFKVAAAGFTPLTGAGTLINLTVSLKAPGTSALLWNEFSTDNSNLPVTLVEGQITVEIPNASPQFTSDPATHAVVDRTYVYTATAEDENGDPLTFNALTLPGWLTFTDHGDGTATLTGTPTSADIGDQEVLLDVSDGKGGSDQQSFTLTVAENTAPEAQDDAAETDEDTPLDLDVLRNDTDAEGDALSVIAVSPPTHGAAETLGASIIRYTPETDYFGTDTFTYTIDDGFGEVATGTVTVTVVPVNDPPVFPTPVFIMPEDGANLRVGGETNADPLDPATPFIVTWQPASDVDSPALTYTWELNETDDFEACCLLRQDTGSVTRYETDLGALAALLDAAGLNLGATTTLYHRVAADDGEAISASEAATITLTRGTLVSVEAGSVALPPSFRLAGNYPNPFYASTRLLIDLPVTAEISVEVYDGMGRRVLASSPKTLPAGFLRPLEVNTRGLSSGLYVARVVVRARGELHILSGLLTLLK